MKTLDEHEIRELISLAGQAREHAYAPYSGFKVGAVLKAQSGAVYMGANMENASYGGCICAERVAMVRALYEGEREFSALCITSSGKAISYPCGICRQFCSEFCTDDMPVICANSDGEYKVTAFSELMPHPFNSID